MDTEWIINALLEAIEEQDWDLIQEVIDYIKEQGEDDLYFPPIEE
jgi:uncharacterized protein YjaG (DUF416 family)|tara:strand:- start:30 stop:164 length:135 start_codon:yes stop_codon:yes gene_type:complete